MSAVYNCTCSLLALCRKAERPAANQFAAPPTALMSASLKPTKSPSRTLPPFAAAISVHSYLLYKYS